MLGRAPEMDPPVPVAPNPPWRRAMSSRILPLPFALLPLVGPLSAQATWTVDDDGPADFTEVADAAASPAVSAGDVLLVEPGTYATAVITKALKVYGRAGAPAPHVGGVGVLGTTGVDLVHLELDELVLNGIAGRARVDDCVVHDSTAVVDCTELVITRSSLSGRDAAAGAANLTAVDVSGASNVQLVDCAVQGGSNLSLGDGRPGLRCSGASRTWVAGSTVRGGDGTSFGPFTPPTSFSGSGIVALDTAYVDVRGSATDTVGAGMVFNLGFIAPALDAQGQSTIEYGGVSVTLGSVAATQVTPPRPFLFIDGVDGPSGQRDLSIFGPAGETALVFGSAVSAFHEFPGLLGVPVWLDPTLIAEVLAFTLAGQDVPVQHSWPLPASFNPGLAYHVQGLVVLAPGTAYVEQPVASGVGAPLSVFAADLDGDGDRDLIATAVSSGEIFWHANADGLGSFGPGQTVTTAVNSPRSVWAADLDGDGDLDAISSSDLHGEVLWFGNADGLGSFGAKQVVAQGAGDVRTVQAADLDGDGDPDVLTAADDNDEVAWYANQGSGTFGAQQLVDTSLAGARAARAADLDGDGDLDVLSASSGDDSVSWYRNLNGAGSFGPRVLLSSSINSALSAVPADLDADGDVDVVVGAALEDDLHGFVNQGGPVPFAPFSVGTGLDNGSYSVAVGDVDGDGDPDLVATSYVEDRIDWYANAGGAGVFGSGQNLASIDTPIFILADDLNADGLDDVFGTSFQGGTIQWYEAVPTGTSLVGTNSANVVLGH